MKFKNPRCFLIVSLVFSSFAFVSAMQPYSEEDQEQLVNDIITMSINGLIKGPMAEDMINEIQSGDGAYLFEIFRNNKNNSNRMSIDTSISILEPQVIIIDTIDDNPLSATQSRVGSPQKRKTSDRSLDETFEGVKKIKLNPEDENIETSFFGSLFNRVYSYFCFSTQNSNNEALDEITMLGLGLRNFSGSNCYINATLQCLRNLVVFKNNYIQFVDNNRRTFIEKNSNAIDRYLADLLQPKGNTTVNPKEFSDEAIRLCFPWDLENGTIRYRQNDPTEFLGGLLGNLAMSHRINELFDITVKKKRECSDSGHVTTKDEPLKSLKLPLVDEDGCSLVDCINAYFDSEEVEVRCHSCSAKSAFEMSGITALPPVLVLSLNRFTHNPHGDHAIKLYKNVKFPLFELSFPGHEGVVYDLRGIVLHQGAADSGHYIAITYDSENSRWLYCNDSTVKEMSLEEVKEIASTGVYGKNKELSGNFTPYLFFYTARN